MTLNRTYGAASRWAPPQISSRFDAVINSVASWTKEGHLSPELWAVGKLLEHFLSKIFLFKNAKSGIG